jgi:hypothetical protein
MGRISTCMVRPQQKQGENVSRSFRPQMARHLCPVPFPWRFLI